MNYPTRDDDQPTAGRGLAKTAGLAVAAVVAIVLIVVLLHLTGVVGPS